MLDLKKITIPSFVKMNMLNRIGLISRYSAYVKTKTVDLLIVGLLIINQRHEIYPKNTPKLHPENNCLINNYNLRVNDWTIY